MLTFAAMILFLELEHARRGPDLDTQFDSAALLHALEKSCSLWNEAKGSYEEAYRVYQILASMLSSFQIPSGSSSSQTTGSPDPPFGIPGLSPQFQPINGSVFMEKDMFRMSNDEMDIDWVGLSYFTKVIILIKWQATWDAFIEGTSFEDGIVY